MKWIKAVLWGALLGATSAAWGSNTATDAPADYAKGVKLLTPGSEQWYSLPLPLEVYHEAVWPDLRDIRVFNRQGDVVPFTLLAEKAQATSPRTIPLRLFPFDSTVQQVTPKQDDERPAAELFNRLARRCQRDAIAVPVAFKLGCACEKLAGNGIALLQPRFT